MLQLRLVSYISHTINKPRTYAYVIYGQANAQTTLSKEFDRLQWLKVLEIEECAQDTMQIPSTLETLFQPQNNAYVFNHKNT